jgi:TonB-dependent receptor
LIFILTSQILWGATGSIEGRVTDASTGEPLFGANVILGGTSLGAAADIDGKYIIPVVPAGSYTLTVSYIGYKSFSTSIQLKEGERLVKNIKLAAVGVTAKEVIVTAQASGQYSAINQQLSASNIENVVSAARIQELPDENAAESVGRLPGVSLIRSGGGGNTYSGGEATQVVIRGLAPQYNMITIDGVELPATDQNDRGTNLSGISSNMVEGIEVSKTVTPDMDAAVFGGTVNFDTKIAKSTPTGAPSISLLAQGGYNNINSLYNNYKFVGSFENRFFNDNLGVFAQGIIQRQDETTDELQGTYGIPDKTKPNAIQLNNLGLYYYPDAEQRYDATLVLDYKLPDGKIAFTNLFSQGKQGSSYIQEVYDLGGSNDIQNEAQYQNNTINEITNILSYEQQLLTVKVKATLSNAFSENITPQSWWMSFEEFSAGTNVLHQNLSPQVLSNEANALTNYSQMDFRNNSTWSNYSKQRNISGTLDLEKVLNLSDLINATFKVGGSYKYTDRYYETEGGNGNIYGTFAATNEIRADIIKEFPWMSKAPYNLPADGTQELPESMFFTPTNFGNYLNGNYIMNANLNTGLISSIMNNIISFGKGVKTAPTGGVNPYLPDVLGSLDKNYSGLEHREAAYIMATVNIGPELTFIPGVRYQGLATSYSANHFLNASATDPYPNTLPHTDTTVFEYHGYWLPDVSLKYDPFPWLSARLAYTSTLSYPDYNAIIPLMDVYSTTVTWNNYALKPAQSQNYDLQVSWFGNTVGLFTVGAFLKQIDHMIFYTNTMYITNPADYPGIPNYTKGFQLTTYINNPYRVNDYGLETEWQTHFWYLPEPFNGLVLNVNWTHIFSSAQYPFSVTTSSGYPKYQSIYIDSSYTDRLENQPNDNINLSLGYDYQKFAVRVSMIYSSQVFNNTNFYNSLRSDKVKYVRWDLSAKQGLPWFGVEAYVDLNNLNSENDNYTIRGSGFPIQSWDYGMTADLGFRWKL